MKYPIIITLCLLVVLGVKAQTTTIDTVKTIRNKNLNRVSTDSAKTKVTWYISDTMRQFNHPFEQVNYDASINQLQIFYKLTVTSALTTDTKIDTSIHRLIIDFDKRQTWYCNNDTAIAAPFNFITISVDSANTIKQTYLQRTVK